MYRDRDVLYVCREERGQYTEAMKSMLVMFMSFALPIVTVFATAL
jgi:hypothetical protein